MMDAARVFAAHGAKVTIIITPYYAKLYQKSIEQHQSLGHEIDFHTFELPTSEFGLPEGCENQLSISFEMSLKLFKAIEKLQEPIEQLLRERCADCIVSDMFFPWTAISAARLGIPGSCSMSQVFIFYFFPKLKCQIKHKNTTLTVGLIR
ncbi:hypothetical protein CsSME_00043080 [Camellia sinensis var. sinensis]